MSIAKDFEVDATIQAKSNKSRKGVVIGNALKGGDQVVAVEWDDGTLAKVNVNDIEITLSMEEEFAVLQKQVNEKLAAAAALIREANQLADTVGKDLQSYDNESGDIVFDSYVLERAMRDSGWLVNTSSWQC